MTPLLPRVPYNYYYYYYSYYYCCCECADYCANCAFETEECARAEAAASEECEDDEVGVYLELLLGFLLGVALPG